MKCKHFFKNIRTAIFPDVILVSNYHGCKGKTINLILHYMIDIIYKTLKVPHPEKLQFIQNIKNLMFQVIFIFSDWIFIKQIIVFSTPFCCWGNRFSNNYAWNFEWGMGAWVKMPRSNAFSRNMNTIKLNVFSTHSTIYTLKKIQHAFLRETKPLVV